MLENTWKARTFEAEKKKSRMPMRSAHLVENNTSGNSPQNLSLMRKQIDMLQGKDAS